MTNELLTIGNITFIIGVLGVIFTVYNYFKNPQEQLDKRQSLTEKEVDNKASILAQQLQWEKEANREKFSDMQNNIKDATALAQNHIHSVDVKIDSMKLQIEQMGKEIIRLTTVIEERLPK